jgi:hypothetical protein
MKLSGERGVRNLEAKTKTIVRVLERKRKGVVCGFKNFPRKRVFCGCVVCVL